MEVSEKSFVISPIFSQKVVKMINGSSSRLEDKIKDVIQKKMNNSSNKNRPIGISTVVETSINSSITALPLASLYMNDLSNIWHYCTQVSRSYTKFVSKVGTWIGYYLEFRTAWSYEPECGWCLSQDCNMKADLYELLNIYCALRVSRLDWYKRSERLPKKGECLILGEIRFYDS